MTLQPWALAALSLGLSALGGAALAQAGGEPILVTAAQLNAQVAKMTDGLASSPVATGPGATVLMAHRDRDGEVEVHAKLADELIIREGHASIRVGGTVAGGRDSAPGERRGGILTGGKVYDLNPGDVIWIPVAMPHQMLVAKGTTVTYMAVKFEAKGQ